LRHFACGLLLALVPFLGATPAIAQVSPEQFAGRCFSEPRLSNYLFLMGYQASGAINCTHAEVDWDRRISFRNRDNPLRFAFEGHRDKKNGEFVIERIQPFLGESQPAKGRCARSVEADGRMITCFAEYMVAGGRNAAAFSFAIAEKDRPGETRRVPGSCRKSPEWEAALQSLLEYEASAPVAKVAADTIGCTRAVIEPGKRYAFANGDDAEDQLVLIGEPDEDNRTRITGIGFGTGPVQPVTAGICADLRREDGELVTACAAAYRAGARERRLVIEFTPTPSR